MSRFQIAGGDSSWSCVVENVLDVLLEMEREREKKEKVANEMLFFPIYYVVITTKSHCCYFQLYWDLHLLNVRNLNTLREMNKPVSHALNRLHQSTEPNTFIKTHHQSDSGSVQSCTFDTDSLQVCACSVADFPLRGISGPVDHHIYFPCTEGGAVGEEGAVWECEDCEEAQESSQALLGQVSILRLGLRS